MGERKCIGGFWYYWRHMTVRFLPSQEWSVGERKCIGGFWYYWQHMTVRFLPSQEWSAGEMEVCVDFWRQWGRQFVGGRRQLADSPMDFRSPLDHSCVGRNLILTGGIAAKFRRRCRPWLRDSCFRRNGPVGELWMDFGIVVARRHCRHCPPPHCCRCQIGTLRYYHQIVAAAAADNIGIPAAAASLALNLFFAV